MKILPFILVIGLFLFSCSPTKSVAFQKSILLQQLKNTHTNQDWFVPTSLAIKGLNGKQAQWKDSTDNHSISQLVAHLTFWNERVLIAYKDDKLPNFDDDNELTFHNGSDLECMDLVQKLDSVQTEWENAILKSTDEKLLEWNSEILNLAAHTAYHTGQIIYIRKRNNWWH
ncbi:DinB family protein [Maribacter sp. X9]|uniref:DinB family protein n=1 Tax=Maribacter sp. X9 TaxID=3402159 RepID=UPI003AF3E909